MSAETTPPDGPLVSVVVPVYNGAEFIEEALRSVLAQTYPNWECVVIDNRSTDGTADVVEAVVAGDPRFRLVRAAEHVGIYGNHNRALAAASPTARYVKVLHSDDWLEPRCLERMVAVAERHPGVGVVGAWRMFGDDRDLDSLPTDAEVFPGKAIVRQSLTGGPYVTGSPSSLLLRATVAGERTPFFDESIWHSDTEAIYAALLHSDLGYVHEIMTSTRLHEAANTPFSDEIKTYAPENLLMLFRHGRAVLTKRQYRLRVVRELSSYSWFLTKQVVKPSRHRDPRFRRFHLDAIRRTQLEVGAGSPARYVLDACEALVRLQGTALRPRDTQG